MLKKRKENKLFFLENLILTYNEDKIKRNLTRLYPIGCFVDQSTAYGGFGSKRIKIVNNDVLLNVNSEDKSVNITIGNTGIWSSIYKKLAKKVI